MTAELRPMRWWDIQPVMRLEHELFAEDAWTETMFWSELADPSTRTYFVAVDDDEVVGYAGLCAYGDTSYIQTIGVTGEHQRSGIGTALLKALLDAADENGARHVDLEVRAGNDAAIQLYERHGFTQLGVRRGYYQPSGADALVMRRSAS